jgi:hypothetical protein
VQYITAAAPYSDQLFNIFYWTSTAMYFDNNGVLAGALFRSLFRDPRSAGFMWKGSDREPCIQPIWWVQMRYHTPSMLTS